MAEILEILAIGGDVGVWALLFAAWRIDKRLSWCEYEIHRMSKKVDRPIA